MRKNVVLFTNRSQENALAQLEIAQLHLQLCRHHSVTFVTDLGHMPAIPADREVVVAKFEREEDLAGAEKAGSSFAGCMLISVGTLTPHGFNQVDPNRMLAQIE